MTPPPLKRMLLKLMICISLLAMRELTHKLCELGWFYRKISEYLKYHREELSFGVVRINTTATE